DAAAIADVNAAAVAAAPTAGRGGHCFSRTLVFARLRRIVEDGERRRGAARGQELLRKAVFRLALEPERLPLGFIQGSAGTTLGGHACCIARRVAARLLGALFLQFGAGVGNALLLVLLLAEQPFDANHRLSVREELAQALQRLA